MTHDPRRVPHYSSRLAVALPALGRHVTLSAGALLMLATNRDTIDSSVVGATIGTNGGVVYWIAAALACALRAAFIVAPDVYSRRLAVLSALVLALVWGLALYCANHAGNQPAAILYAALTVEEAVSFWIARRTAKWWSRADR